MHTFAEYMVSILKSFSNFCFTLHHTNAQNLMSVLYTRMCCVMKVYTASRLCCCLIKSHISPKSAVVVLINSNIKSTKYTQIWTYYLNYLPVISSFKVFLSNIYNYFFIHRRNISALIPPNEKNRS